MPDDNRPEATASPNSAYHIGLAGHWDGRWQDCFGGLCITLEHSGLAVLTGPVSDQAALHGLPRTVCGLGMPLISVRRV